MKKHGEIVITVFPDGYAWLRENLPDIGTDRISAVYPIAPYDPDGFTSYVDDEEGTKKQCYPIDHFRALQLLCEQVGRTLFVGGIKSPYNLLDAGNWDVEVADAFYQLVYRGEVIYG